MTGFDTVLVADWSAGKRSPERPSKDAIWVCIARDGVAEDPVYHRNRIAAEAWIADLIRDEQAAGRRLLATFDFPFGYPRGVARVVTGQDDPFALWDWLAARITDDPAGANNRFEVAEALNALFDGPGPFWGKTHRDRWPGVPYRKADIRFDQVAERRRCDHVAQAASSCFQLAFPPTVGSQVLMGLPMLARLRQIDGVAVWPFEAATTPVVLAEIWPGLIEPAVQEVMQAAEGTDAIRDRVQVALLAQALSRLPDETLAAWLNEVPSDAREEAWILGAGHADILAAYARPVLRNDCFALPPGVHWTPVDAALEDLRTRLSPVTAVETRAVSEAAGCILAARVRAVRAHPPLPNTAVDGYGFAGGLDAGPHALPLVAQTAAAGAAPDVLVPAGQAIRILTGAALPQGVDTVVLQEDTTVTDGTVHLSGPIKAGANTRKAGEDVTAGQELAAVGRRLTPADLGLLTATGVSQVDVRRRLRVAILSTGTELVEAGAHAAPGQIYDANRPMLLSQIAALGHEPVDMGRVPDDRDALRAALEAAATQADVILTSGGASAGDEDHVSALLAETGSMALWRVAIKPGRPLALGMWGGAPVFGLPGNPVAALVCTLVFAAPALSQLAGGGWTAPRGFDLPAAFEKRKKAGRREFLRARVRGGAVEVFASEGSGRISGLSWADGLVELPDAALHVRRGDPVRFIPWAGFGG
ncbi:gephyrin-like molybdotransferase Glp [uncultured Tateyamaria sp.]|uniref:molybdopterin-binding protein n=1 Tax=Tateyamaria sp. 1078 TaxID=3417464 RepID=UPI0026091427|nr:gephyrin-like molybdotransferase Glp [uncultured Tateyamaria sp.]